MKILVSGASGVVGRRLIPILIRAGHTVTAVAHSPLSRRRLELIRAAVAEVDLFDARSVAGGVAGHEVVINLATHIPHSSARMLLPWAWRENDRLRKVASRLLVDACVTANVSRFIQESFAPVYPDRGDRWIDETTPIEPARYNRTIADAERAAQRFAETGRAGVILRFGAFYGPDSVQTRDLVSLIRRGWAPIPGPADVYISSVSHDDAAAAVASSIDVPSGIYNVIDDEPVTHRVFVDSLAEAIGVAHPRLPPAWITPLLGSAGEMLARSVRISNRKLRAASGWTIEYPSVRQGWRAIVGGLDASGLDQAAAGGRDAGHKPGSGGHHARAN